MDCRHIQKLISKFIAEDLSSRESAVVREHLKVCPACRLEIQMYEKSWEVLKEAKDLEPEPAYISRFWTEVSSRDSVPWHQRLARSAKRFFSRKNLNLTGAGLAAGLVVILLLSTQYFNQNLERSLASLPEEKIELLENMDLAQHFDVIQDIDLLEDLDVLEDWDSLEAIKAI